MGTDQERGQELQMKKAPKIIWLVPSFWEGLCLSTQREGATVEFIRFLSLQWRGTRAMSEAVGTLV